MAFSRRYPYNMGFMRFADLGPPAQFREVPRCFVRKDHSCGKFLGASKSCFVACPATEEVETMLALIIEKLTKIGIEPVIATKERAYGQDIFCTKICGKVIESQFCIVILDDVIEKSDSVPLSVPNPNVYYEYGLMTALGKHVIPLQKSGQELAFNIQTHDTIKYSPRNISAELDRALKDATRFSEEGRFGDRDADVYSQQLYGRSLEISGYERRDYNWFLHEDIGDTVFSGFAHPQRREYLFFAVVHSREMLRAGLTDMQVTVKRVESKYEDLTKELESLAAEIENERAELQGPVATRTLDGRLVRMRQSSSRYSLQQALDKSADRTRKAEFVQNAKFAIVLAPEVAELKQRLLAQYDALEKGALALPLFVGDVSGISIAGLEVVFRAPEL